MAPNKQKLVAPKRPGAQRGRPRKTHDTSARTESSAPAAGRPKLKLNFKRGAKGQSDGRGEGGYEGSLGAPALEDAVVKEDAVLNDDAISKEDGDAVEDGQGKRRGARQRKAPQRDDVVYGSEMDKLVAASTTVRKVGEEYGERVVSPPPAVVHRHTPDPHDSSTPVQGLVSRPVSQDVHDILATLQCAPEMQVDLPTMWADEAAGVPKPYSSTLLTSLYIECYASARWHLCDLIADTWIRALQAANLRSHSGADKQCHMWRRNKALEAQLRAGKLGFKKAVRQLGLHVEDPDLHPSAAAFEAPCLRELYEHTRPRCGARLLWADAMALAGRKVESEMARRPEVWPAELFYDVMCAALRLVGRKLTLKIEEKYEGAWCRYHEHVKHGLPCYRELAALQNGAEGGGGVERGAPKGKKRARDGDGGLDPKRVRFGGGGVGDVRQVVEGVDVDAEGESEEG